jgi:hypothetical protein
MVIGFLLFAQMRADGSYAVDVLPGMVTAPLGFGLTMPALMSLGMSDSRPEDAGVTSGLFNTAQQVGGSIGLAAVVAIATARTTGTLADGERVAAVALTDGYRAGMLTAAAVALAASLLTAVLLPRRAADAAPIPEPMTDSGSEPIADAVAK